MLRRVCERKRWIFPGGILESIVVFPSLLAPFWTTRVLEGCFMTENPWNYFQSLQTLDKCTSKVTNRSSNSRWQGVYKGAWLSAYSSELPQDCCPKVWSLYEQVKFVFSVSASASVSTTHLRIPSAAHPPSDSHSTLTSLPVLFSNPVHRTETAMDSFTLKCKWLIQGMCYLFPETFVFN